ncbi:MAG: ABC transporter permease subunit [Chloroflexi bacterium]|nr:ABC transporter permease subunit [Chloroflexota bacterium]
MITEWVQAAAIARNEFRMQWRRRALLVITLAMLLVAVAPVLMLKNELDEDQKLSEKVENLSSRGLMSFVFIPVGAVLAMVLPFIMADAIPKDKQLGVRELLDSTPLTTGTYLLGKMLGSWLSVLVSLLAVILPVGAAWWWLIGKFDVTYVEPWLIGMIPMMVINMGLAVLITAGQPDSRRAIPIIVAFFVLLPAVIGFSPNGDWRDAFNPLRPGLFFHYTDTLRPNPAQMSVEAGTSSAQIRLLSVELTIISGLAQLGLVWLVVWRWMQRAK